MIGANNTGILSTSYMQSTFAFQPKLLEALLIIKHILEVAQLNEGYRGGISSYNIFIMLICYTEEK
jgi:DNA polymerase sigma